MGTIPGGPPGRPPGIPIIGGNPPGGLPGPPIIPGPPGICMGIPITLIYFDMTLLPPGAGWPPGRWPGIIAEGLICPTPLDIPPRPTGAWLGLIWTPGRSIG